MNKLDIVKQTRKIAADTLFVVLEQTLKENNPVSEAEFRDKWLLEMQKHKQIFGSGWYTPPPSGIVVLFASKTNPKRADFTNLRPKEFWPRDDIFLDIESGYAYLFASPTHRQSGLIGDFSINIYLGNEEKIKKQLKKSVKIIDEIFNFIKTNISFSDIFKFADNTIAKNGLRNNIVSITNPDGVNMGHTIPASYEDWTEEELKKLRNADNDWISFKDIISKKRIFESIHSSLKVKPGMAFTIEPAVKVVRDNSIPMTMFHKIAFIRENGEKELLANFDQIFKLCGMNYMLT